MDAIVIGGGPSGATAALMLARGGWSVSVIEKSEFPRRKVCGEYVSATNFPLLSRLGVLDQFLELAGPEVRQVGMFARDRMMVSGMPEVRGDLPAWGRALGREHLDGLLLQAARKAGAAVWQPWSAVELLEDGEEYNCKIISRHNRESKVLRSRVVIAAHGSWDRGMLPTQFQQEKVVGSDLFGFKAHFHDCHLPSQLMPLIAFPGGYGGMVSTDQSRVSLSCCVRLEQLEKSRRALPEASAAEAVFEHIRRHCRGVRDSMSGARQDGPWLSAGPIRPGIRLGANGRVFTVGNAAGEAHPIVAEGISMAIQSAWLLCERLLQHGAKRVSPEILEAVKRDYVLAWRRSFSWRIHTAGIVAQLAMRAWVGKVLLPVVAPLPGILTKGAAFSGKMSQILPLG
jgi:2-polyprenyl-6-methoxyphenol hydroxylase-like FAD-dependent oxidoreductase